MLRLPILNALLIYVYLLFLSIKNQPPTGCERLTICIISYGLFKNHKYFSISAGFNTFPEETSLSSIISAGILILLGIFRSVEVVKLLLLSSFPHFSAKQKRTLTYCEMQKINVHNQLDILLSISSQVLCLQ